MVNNTSPGIVFFRSGYRVSAVVRMDNGGEHTLTGYYSNGGLEATNRDGTVQLTLSPTNDLRPQHPRTLGTLSVNGEETLVSGFRNTTKEGKTVLGLAIREPSQLEDCPF